MVIQELTDFELDLLREEKKLEQIENEDGYIQGNKDELIDEIINNMPKTDF